MKKYVIILKDKKDPCNRFNDELLEVNGWEIDSQAFIYHDANWYITDKATGATIVWGHSKKEALEKYNNEELQKALHDYRFTGSYEQQVLRFKNALLRDNIESMISYEKEINRA